jgi:hypothetical protein
MITRFLFVVAVLAAQPLVAQTMAGTKSVWKKRVARVIDMRPPTDDKPHRLKPAGDDSTLLQMFVGALYNHKLTAYSDPEFSIAHIVSMPLLDHIMHLYVDTIVVVDPVTGHEYTQIARSSFNYDSATKIRVLEDWTFNTITGKTEIQVAGLAPVRNAYSDDGTLRGVQALFWLRYSDVQTIVARYEQYHPESTIAARIWDDYFLSDEKPVKVK